MNEIWIVCKGCGYRRRDIHGTDHEICPRCEVMPEAKALHFLKGWEPYLGKLVTIHELKAYRLHSLMCWKKEGACGPALESPNGHIGYCPSEWIRLATQAEAELFEFEYAQAKNSHAKITIEIGPDLVIEHAHNLRESNPTIEIPSTNEAEELLVALVDSISEAMNIAAVNVIDARLKERLDQDA